MRSIFMLAGTAAVALAALPAAAQNRQVKPYFLVVFDTSGSMSDPLGSANSCGFTGTANEMGNPIRTRKIDTAKCVLGKIVNSTGDADFGLMQFAQTGCSTQASGGGTCNNTQASAQLRVPITTNTAPAISALIDNVPAVALTGSSVARPADELCPGGYTPLGGTLDAAKEYFEAGFPVFGGGMAPAPTTGDTALDCRPLAVILLTDGAECCSPCTTSWSGCPNAAAATGITCQTNTCGTVTGSCPGGNHFESAPERAYELRSSVVPRQGGTSQKEIKTYVIGFGISEGDVRIENIARAGGTDAPGPHYGFYASNEAALALAFNQIIADAQPPSEECNNEDDDCDGLVDEGIPKYCNKPAGIDDPATCAGASDPTVCCDEPDEQLCDGEDDDCDGLIDEGVLNACGMCGDVPPEICDAIDNDCDSKIDEMTEGGACGSDEGRCDEGVLRCVNGKEECRGEVGPEDETCNCMDDDCDGDIDEDVDGNLCPDGKCIGCKCVPRCEPGEEFMPKCDPGRRPERQENGECLCIIDNCDPQDCQQMTMMRGDDVGCAPDDPKVAPCSCRAGMCTARCDGVTCARGQVCNPRNGRCVEDNCRGFGCPEGELCDALEAECTTDPCANADCADDEVCRGGSCERSCANVTCEGQQRCSRGSCIDDPCVGVRCDRDEVCDPESGECIDTPCFQSCGSGLVCNVESGECDRDPCWDVQCPAGQSCEAGECMTPGGPVGGRGGSDDEPGKADPNARVLAAGGGGCACRVAEGPAPGGTSKGSWLLLLCGAALLVRARGRRARALAGAVLLMSAGLLLGGCSVQPFCIDCADAGRGGNAGQNGSAGRNGNDGGPKAGKGGTLADAGPDSGDRDGGGSPIPCEPEPETCDGTDEDCDFKVDEEVEAEDNDCNQLGICSGTRPICLNGEFTCRYPSEREDSETLCDGQDNDCDGRTDEAFAMLGTPCDVGVGACKNQGHWVCDDAKTGLRCDGEPKDPEDEICDGIDNDCDSLVDEPRSDPGSAPSFVEDDVVQVNGNLWIYRYEASRPDAKEDAQGVIGSRACSRAGVLPWTNLTYEEAVAACEAADMELCSANDWRTACRGGSCAWSFVPEGGSCPTGQSGYPANASPAAKNACNGHDLTAAAGAADNDALAPTGAYPRCFTTNSGEPVFDLSGNAKEWVTGPNSGASSDPSSPLLGGSYNNLPGGMRCDFDFAVAKNGVRLRNVGFRCCSSSAP